MLPTSSRLRALLVAGLALVSLTTAACREIPAGALGESRSDTAGDRPDLRIALLGAVTGSSRGPASRALEGARFAFDEVNAEGDLPVDLVTVSVDTEEDPVATADAVAEEIVADPEVVAVIGWPTPAETPVIEELLSQAGIAFINLSPSIGEGHDSADGAPGGERAASGGARLRAVADERRQLQELAKALAQGAGSDGRVCLTGDGSPRSDGSRRLMGAELDRRGVETEALVDVEPELLTYAEVAEAVARADCSTVFWGGGGTDAAVLRLDLNAAGAPQVRLAGTDAMKSEAYLVETGPDGDGTLVSCSCVDLSEGQDVESRGFIQEFQARYGGTPGAYAAEGYDVGGWLIEQVAAGAVDRASLADAVIARPEFEGLGGTYRFDDRGERTADTAPVQVFEARAGRWEPLRLAP